MTTTTTTTTTTTAAPPLSAVTATVYTVPTDQPEADGTLTWDSTTLVTAQVTAGGRQGLGWTYASPAVKAIIDDTLAAILVGADPFAIPGLHETMVRACRNQGRPGLAACAISALDIALWDLKARLVELPLSDLWGRAHGTIPIYGSGGFTSYDDDTTRRQLEGWIAAGIPRVKIKIGEDWGSCADRDLHRVALTRATVGSDVEVYVDANGGYTRKQAIRVGRQLVDEAGVSWFEEPVSSDDTTGLKQVRDRCAADIAAGEYGYSPSYFAHLIDAQAVDCVQADVTRCGGYTAWLSIAQLAAAHGLQISGHCAPNLHAHAAACIPNLRHLEYFHDHTRIEDLLFDGLPLLSHGALHPGAGPGHGMSLRGANAQRYRVA